MHSIVSVGSKYLLLVLSNSLKLTNKTNLLRGYTYTYTYEQKHRHSWEMSPTWVCVWIFQCMLIFVGFLAPNLTCKSLKGWSRRPRGSLALLSNAWVWGMLVRVHLNVLISKETKHIHRLDTRPFHRVASLSPHRRFTNSPPPLFVQTEPSSSSIKLHQCVIHTTSWHWQYLSWWWWCLCVSTRFPLVSSC